MQSKLNVEITSEADSKTKLEVQERGHEAVVDEPKDFGGNDEGPNPLEYMFTGLAGCMNVTIHHIANERDMAVESLEIDVKGDIDLEKFMKGTGDRAGFENINLEINVETDSSHDAEEDLIRAAEERCPVSDNLRNSTRINVKQL